jgi:anaerobic selenocysteine-containing dehydrogenase
VPNQTEKRCQGRGLLPGHAHWETLLEDLLAPAGLSYADFVERVLSTAQKFKLPALPAFNGSPAPENAAYPVLLTGAKDPDYLHSAYRWVDALRQKSPRPMVSMHPETAALHNVQSNDEVIIETPSDAITQFDRLTETIGSFSEL